MEARHPPLGPTILFNLPPELADHPDYEVLRELGHGGMGVVYQAKHRLSGRMEVLKVMSKALIGQAESRERFLREIQSAARLDHRNVVRMYTALERGELMVLVMEYVEGEDLAREVEARGPLSVLNACFYTQQVALGLQHAFEKGMVHRDIKPQNLMLIREGKKHTIKILDFGLAKATRGENVDAKLTTLGAMMGTPGYVAPEQILDAARADIRADIYSLGCTLYHLLAGAPPFSGQSLFEILQAHHSVEARPLNAVRPEVPAAVAAVVRKMMAKETAQRYSTPAEVVQALEPFVKPAAKGTPPKSSPAVPVRAAKARSEEEKRLLRAETSALSPQAAQATILPVEARQSRDGRKPSPAAGKTWLIVSLAVGLLLAGLLGLIISIALSKHSPSATTMADPSFDKDRMKEPSRKANVSNSIGMKFAWCPPGTFLMGSPPSEAVRSDGETQHKVTLTKGFYVGTHEVTQAQWRAVMGNNPSNFKGDNLPVENVTWKDCQDFCTKLGQVDGKRYRLPTEGEWEYACRAGSTTAYFFGDDPKQLGDYAWYKANAEQKTHEVGAKEPNAWGLYDMHGNVWEWCQDGYGPYPQGDLRDPQGSNNNSYVFRGGSWENDPWHCRAASPGSYAPGRRYDHLGCRVALCLD